MSLKKKQHEGFAKFFEKPTRENLRSLIKDNIGETDYLDFKREWPTYQSLAKHILALSNTQSGAITVGVEEKDDGTLDPKGLKEFLDKEKISKGISKYLPSEIDWDVYEFAYEDSEYSKLIGKKFQVILVNYDARRIPLLCQKAGEGIKENVVYVRKGTNSTEATHNDLQQIVNQRIETGYSSSHVLDLSAHLQQLKELYEQKETGGTLSSIAIMMAAVYGNKYKEYFEFIDKMIYRKKEKIIKLLDL